MLINNLNNSQIFKSYYKKPSDLFSWKEVAFLINNHFYNLTRVVGIDDKDIPLAVNDWEGKHQDSSFINKKILEGHAVLLPNVSRYNEKLNNICKALENIFPGSTVDVHAFAGKEGKNGSFRIHSDITTNFIFQIEGFSDWTVYKETSPEPGDRENDDGLTEEIKDTLEPGDVLYIPNKAFHYCQPKGKRLSLSFAINFHGNTKNHINREYYNYE